MRPTNQWDDLLVLIISRISTSKPYASGKHMSAKTADPPTFTQLSKFITKRIDLLETISVPELNKSKTSENRSTSAHATFTDKCAFCAATHFIVRCDAFKEKTVSERKDFVNKKQLCVNCLGFHPVRSCQSKRGVPYATDSTILCYTNLYLCTFTAIPVGSVVRERRGEKANKNKKKKIIK